MFIKITSITKVVCLTTTSLQYSLFNISSALDDYTPTTELLTFGPSSPQLFVTIPIASDAVYEPDVEQFFSNLVLETPNPDVTVRPDEAVILINDDDRESV